MKWGYYIGITVKELFLIAESELEDYKRPIKWAVNYEKDLMSQFDFTEDEFENVHTEINDYMKGFTGKPLKILDTMLEAFELYE